MKIARVGSMVMLGVFITTAMLPVSALAGRRGRRNTAYALTGAAVYSLLRHKPKTALVLGAGAAYAWSRYNKAKPAPRHHRAYRAPVGRGDRGHHYGWYKHARPRAKAHWARHRSYRCGHARH